MAVGLARGIVLPDLRRRNDVARIFDGPGAQQDLLMARAGISSESRRHKGDRGASTGQVAVELGKAHVIADGES